MISSFIKRSCSSSHLNNTISNNNNDYNNNQQTYFKSYLTSNNNHNHYSSSNLNINSPLLSKESPNDDSFSLEEIGENCIYQVIVKKIYNKNLEKNINNNNDNNSSININNNGTYKPITNGFFSHVNNNNYYTDNNNNNNHNNSNNNNNSDGLVYTRVKIKQLKYASLDKFIENLVNVETGDLDENLAEIFLATYRTFTDTLTVIRMLKRRYEQIMPASLEMTEDIRVECLKSYRKIVRIWLENYIEDFNEPAPFSYTNLKELKRFAKDLMIEDEPEMIKLINSRYQYLESQNKKNDVNNFISTNLNIAKNELSVKPPPVHPTVTTIVTKKPSFHSKSNSTSNFFNQNHSSEQNLFLKSPRAASQTRPLYLSKNSMENLHNPNTDSNNFSLNLTINDDFMSIDSIYFAEQLTYIDKCLFQKVCAHHYLGPTWSTRNKKTKHNASSSISIPLSSSNTKSFTNLNNVDNKTQKMASSMTTTNNNLKNQQPVTPDKFASDRAFIDQFNCVSFVVQAKVLENSDLKPVERARIIRKWIEIAQACRKYKNFNSLNAIIQGLNTKCVSRLTKTWNELPLDVKSQFDELTEMFSEEQNVFIYRDILKRNLKEYKSIFESPSQNSVDDQSPRIYQKANEMNFKSINYDDISFGINATMSRKMKEKLVKSYKKNQIKEINGIVPFLGLFTKDLEFLHSQYSMKNDKGMINVMKLRKEHEIIAQIKLLQRASKLYHIKEDPSFNVWLHKQQVYSGDQYYEFSYQIEPKFDRDNSSASNGNLRKQKYSSLSQTSKSNSIESIENGSNYLKTPLSQSKLNHSPSNPRMIIDHSRNSSMGSSDLIESTTNSSTKRDLSSKYHLNGDTNSNNTENSNEENLSAKFSQQSLTPSNEMRIKVHIEYDFSNNQNEKMIASTVVYKQLSISDKYRTKDVKRLILQKFFLNPDLCDNYILVQVFNGMGTQNYNENSNGELIINDKDNVFYAARKVNDMQFVLRPKNSYSNNKSNLLPPHSPHSNGNINKLNNGYSNNKMNTYQKNWFKKWI